MTALQLHQLVNGYIATWLSTYDPDLPVDWDGAPASPQLRAAWDNHSAAWIRPVVESADTNTVSIGSDPNPRTEGRIVVQVFVPANTTIRQALEIGDSLGQHLQYWRPDTLVTDCYNLDRGGESDGWNMAVLSVEFTAG